jgi:PAS domain S-box-containing protein
MQRAPALPAEDMLVADFDDDRAFRARVLRVLAYVILGLALVVIALDTALGYEGIALARVLIVLSAVLSLLALRAGRVRLGWMVLLLTTFAGVSTLIWNSGGLAAPQFAFPLLLVFMAGRMLGPRWAIGFAVIMAACVLGLAALHSLDLVPASQFPENPFRKAVPPVIILLLAATLSWYVFRHSRRQVKQLRWAHQRIADSEARFRDFAAASGDWFWETDAEGRFTWLSESVEQGLGLSPASHYGKTRVELTAGFADHASTAWKGNLDALARREPFRDFRYLRPAATDAQWVSISGAPYHASSGEFLGYRGTGSIVTRQVQAEEAAHRANLRLKAAVEELDETFVLCDPSDRIVVANRRFRDTNPAVVPLLDTACRFEDYLRIVIASGAFPQAVGREEAFISERLAQRRMASTPVEREMTGGRWFLLNDRRLEDGSTITMGLDITERKQHELALQASEARLRATLDNAPAVAVQQFDACGRVLYWNRASELLYGYSAEEALGKTLDKLFWTPAQTAEWLATLHETASTGQPYGPVEAPLTNKAGEQRVILYSSFAIPETGGGHRFVCMDVDITERKRAELAVRQSEARFADLFHKSRVPQLVSNPRTRETEDVNQAFVDLLGHPRERLLGARGSDLELFWDATDSQEVARAHAAGGTNEPVEIRSRRANGEQCIVLGSAFTIQTASGPRIAWSMVDVTEQRAAQRQVEELNASLESKVEARTAELKSTLDNLKVSQDALLQSEKLAALGRLVAGVAHELNTPIGNALLTASTASTQAEEFERQAQAGLRRSVLQGFVASSRQASSILMRNLEKAAELIRSFKQVAADQASSQRRGFILKEVVDEVLLAHHPIFKKTAVAVTSDVPEGIRLDSYPGPLGQVLGNLITNAVLHGFEDRSKGSVTISARLDGEDAVEIAVRDDGRGISEANLKRIFDPFFTTRMGRGGTGLGLSICHRIVTESLGGSIRVASRLREGSSFIVHIPLRAPAVAQQEAA